ncbi:2-amino-4-hydroxy-6-hydroxymethyldihydropteridine diphosphokinase [Planctomycetota bacterium]|nr:2-amino-4-hydroxy-6-hydroxymethyldihydropteridine diphosphokinase [Planctomycetota bacterium]
MKDVYLGIGSNLGDRTAHLKYACDQIAQFDLTYVIAVSPFYETAPLTGEGVPDNQGTFLNGAIHLQTDLQPTDLLRKLQHIETEAGRVVKNKRVHWGPRELDIDILLVGKEMINEDEELTVPHPRMCERWFVLKPLADIAENFVHPLNHHKIGELLRDLEEQSNREGNLGLPVKD